MSDNVGLIEDIRGLCWLAASVPAPGFHTVRYGRDFPGRHVTEQTLDITAGAEWRPLIVPAAPSEDEQSESAAPSPDENCPAKPPADSSLQVAPLAELLTRSFPIDLCCPNCGATMRGRRHREVRSSTLLNPHAVIQ